MNTKQSTKRIGLRFAMLFLLSFIVGTSVFASGLSGTYTINPAKAASATNYRSFNDADSDLTLGSRASGGAANGPGVSGAVIFNVSDGIYYESVDIPAITGTSSKNTITFQGHSGDSTKVMVQAYATGSYSSPGFVFHFDGTNHIILNEITLHMDLGGASYSYYDHVLIVDNVSDSNTVSNCQLIGADSGGVSYYGACIYSGYNYTTYTYSQDEYNTFYNNYLTKAYYGTYWMGSFSSGGAEKLNVFSNNIVDSVDYYGMFFYTQDGIQILNNQIRMRNGYYGLMMDYIGYSYYGNSDTALIANNFIGIASSTYGYGIYSFYPDKAKFVYNNVNMLGSSNNATYLYSYSASALYLYNNNFTTGGATPIYAYGLTKEDYNNPYNGLGGSVVSYNGTTYATLAKWKASGLGFGAHDTSVDPIYVSNFDLHVNNPAINGMATPLSYVTKDIDNETRNTSTPDIGADEFTPAAVYPAITLITNPTSGFCVGSQDVYVKLFNYGTSTLTSVTIEWSVSGVAQTAYSWTGSLSSATSTLVKVGSYAFSSASTVYPIVSYPSSANGVSISSTTRNTASTSVRSGLSGTFSIDPAGSGTTNYTSFRAAVSDLNLKGVCGAITYNVADGYYNESVYINNVPGTSATNTVTFQSKSLDSSKVTLDTAWSGTYSNPGTTVIINGSNYINFRLMTITNTSTATYGYAGVVYLSGGTSNTLFERNVLWSSASVYTYAPVYGNANGSNENMNTLRFNSVSGSYYTIQLQGSYSAAEYGNNIYRNYVDSSLGYGMMAEYQDSLSIVGNNIFMPSNGYNGIYVYQATTNGGGKDSSLIANNFITTSGTYCYGMMIYYSNLINIYNNSINNSTSYSYYYAAYIYNYSSGIIQNFVNNIVVADAGASCLYAYNVTYSDYNDFYPVTGAVGYWNGSFCTALSDLQAASSQDAHSVSGDPMYNSVSTGDLHLTKSSKIVLHAGRSLGSVKTDIDGQIRNGATPNMGADETKVYGNDASAYAIDSPSAGFCAGTKNVYVRVVNAGNNTLSSVTVNWSVNGTTMTSYSWTGTLNPGSFTLVKVGSVTFASTGTKTFLAWTSSPNGSTDSFTANDTCAPKTLGGGMNGTYTIGGTSPDYNTFLDAVNDLNKRGVCGLTTFNVRDGYYNEAVTIKHITGTSPTNRVIFQSQSLDSTKVIIDSAWAGSWSARGYAVRLDGASYVTFRKLTIHNDPGSYYVYADALEIAGKSHDNLIENNVIKTSTGYYATYGSAIYDDGGSADNNNSYINNQINGGMYTLYMSGTGTGSGSAEYGTVIANNLIDSGSYMGAYLNYQDSMTFNANVVLQTSGYYGLYLYYINGNSTTDTSLISNNFIDVQATYSYGIMGYYSNMVNIYNNTIYSSASYTYYYNVYLYNYTSANVNFVNNILDNDNGGTLFYIYSSAVKYSDYNDYYASSGFYGNWSGSCYSLTDIQNNGMDKHSVVGDPYLNSPSTGDLHLTKLSKAVLHKGIPRTSVPRDFDGQMRSAALPNIGADETRVYGNDLTAYSIDSPVVGFCSGTKDVYVRFMNAGNNTITSASVNWTVNGTTMTSYSWTGSLAPGGSALVKVGSVTFASGSIKTFYAWTSSPNGGVDSFTANDTTGPVRIGAGLSGTYTIGGVSPDFATFLDATNALSSGGVCGAVVFNVRNGSYNESVTLGAIKGASATNTVTFQSQSGDSSKVILDTAWAGSWSSRGYTVRLNGTSYVTFKKITILNNTSTMYSYSDGVEIAGGSNYNTFTNCVIAVPTASYATYGSAIYDDGSSTDNYNNILNNQVNGGYYIMYLAGTYSKSEMGNVIRGNIFDSGSYMGTYLYYQDSINVTKNKIIMNQGYYAMYIYSISANGTTKDSSLIANNFISINSTYCYAVMAYNCMLLNFYNNSIYSSSSYSYYYTTYFYNYSYGSVLNIVNNIVSNSGGSPALYMYYYSGTVFSDYNDWYTTGSTLGYWNGSSFTSISGLSTINSMDAHSISGDPMYNNTATGDLHLTTSSSIVMHDGAYRNSVPDDIDGQTRAAKPNMGADETHMYQIDASAMSIDSPAAGFCSGTKNVYVRLFNAGATSLTSVTMNWSVNGTAMTSYSWTGTLPSLSSTLVKVGSVTFVSGVSKTIKAWTSNPNSATDSNNINDTTSARKGGGLNGTYTIGGASPSYATFRGAVNDLNAIGVCGAVVFNVRDGAYNESVSLGAITGSNATNTITFQSQSGDSTKVILDTSWSSSSYAAPGYVVKLSNASYINFKKMTLINAPSLSYNYADGVFITAGSSHNTFTSNVITTNTSSSTYNYGSTVHNDYNTTDPYNNFTNNQINGGYYAVNLCGPYSSTGGELGNVFYHNMIDSAYYMTMYIEYEDSMMIAGNNIFATAGYYGIYMYGVQGNGSGSDSSYIINNFVTMTASYGYAIYGYYNDMLNIYNNSIYSSSSYSWYYTVYLYDWTTHVVHYVDNITQNDGGGAAIYTYNSIVNSDFNDWYTTGSTLAYWNGTTCSTLSDIQTANSMDAHSLSTDAMFNSPSTGDLHLTSLSSALMHVGYPFAIVTEDIDQQKRAAKPNIGADETRTYDYDAAIQSIDSPAVGFCSGAKDVYARLFNAGAKTMTSVTINWTVNGTAMTAISWTGTLASYTSTLVKLGSVTFASGSSKVIKVWSSKPNGQVDSNNVNDTSSAHKGGGLTGTYTIGGTTPDFATFRAAAFALNSQGICGPVLFNVRDGYYNESVSLNNIAGSSKTNSITFQSQSLDSSKVILDTTSSGSYSGHGYAFQLNGTQYTKIRKMTITNVGGSYDDVVQFTNGAAYDTIERCVLTGNTSGGYNYGSVIYDNPGSVDEFLTIRYNQLSGDYYTVYLSGTGATVGSAERGNVLYRNYIDSGNGEGVVVQYQDSITVSANNIFQTSGYYGMYLYGIIGNGGGVDSSYIMNNFVTVQGSYEYGIMINYVDLTNVYNNSINTSSSYYYYGSLYVYNTSGSLNIYNNAIVNDNSGSAVYLYGSGINTDYNDYYTASGTYLAYWGGSYCSSLSDIQTASGSDANSQSADPMYNNTSIGDLHATSSSTIISNDAMVLKAVTEDIDGNPRSTTKPDIGADEFGAYPDDLGVSAILSPANKDCGNTSTYVTVKVHNYGTKAESSYSVYVKAVGGSTYTTSKAISTTINAGADAIVTLTFSPALNTSAGGSWTFTGYTVLSGDGDATNDTSTVTVSLNAPPKAKFSVAKLGAICQGDTFAVTDGSTYSGTASYKYYLVNSLGVKVDSSTSANPHLYAASTGAYRIYQGIATGTTCYDSTSTPVTIYANPVVSFTASTACPGDSAHFYSTSTAGSGTISSYAWNFGNGKTASTMNAGTVYAQGTYTAMLTVTNSNGCKASATKPIGIDSAISRFSYKVDTTINKGTISLKAGDTTMTTYSWDYGDASVGATVATTSHQYTKPGRYAVKLTTTNGGCTTTTIDSITVMWTGINETPAVNYSLNIYPNPFKDQTTIAYSIDNAAQVKVEVMDVLGRTVATLVNHHQVSGSYNVSFNATEFNNANAGIYIVRMSIGDRVITKQITLVK